MVARRGRLDVLLVDDDPSITELVRRLLEGECEVREAGGVCEALAAMTAQEPDIVVTDLEMDAGGGKYLLAAVTDEHPGVLRLVYSAAPCSRLVALIDSDLADAAVSKSEPWSALVSEVRRLARAMTARQSSSIRTVP